RLAGLDHLERRNQALLWKGLLEGQVKFALRFSKTPPTDVLKGAVPLIPEAAGLMSQLGASGQFEGDALVNTAKPDIKGRTGLDQVGYFPQVFELAIPPRDHGMTELAHQDYRR